MPLLVDLSDWRSKLAEIEDSLFNSTDLLDVVFVADFPGEFLAAFLFTAEEAVADGMVVMVIRKPPTVLIYSDIEQTS